MSLSVFLAQSDVLVLMPLPEQLMLSLSKLCQVVVVNQSNNDAEENRILDG